MILAPGDRAPDFRLPDQFGTDIHLAEVVNRSVVVLVFYPFAFSPVCGAEMQDLQRAQQRLRNESQDVEIIAVSVDSKYALAAWAHNRSLSIPLCADFWPHGQVAQDYGVFDTRHGVAERGVFVIDRDGTIGSGRQVGRSEQRDFGPELEMSLALAAA